MEGLSIEKKSKAVLAVYDGELTLDVTQDLKKNLKHALDETGFKILVLDLSKVNFIDSSGIGFLVSLASRLRNAGVDFRMLKPSVQVGKTLELVQLKSYFNIIESGEELEGLL